MKLVIKDYVSIEIDEVWNWKPEKNSGGVFFDLTLTIGPSDEEGGQHFLIYIANTTTLEEFKVNNSSWLQEKVIYFEDCSWSNIIAHIEVLVSDCDKGAWEESLNCLRRCFIWEYENHKFEDDYILH